MLLSFRCLLSLVVTYSLLCGIALSAQTASLIKDINTTDDHSYTSSADQFTELDGTVYFSAKSHPHVDGLWRTDGTPSGTSLVRDQLSVHELLAGGSTLLFAANDGISGLELWRSDGTTEGTVLVKDIAPGPSSGFYMSPMVEIDSTIFFVANDGTTGPALWKSDGTEVGTTLVKDIDPSLAASLNQLVNLDGTLYFVASDGVNGAELWRSDGSSAGTVMVKDIYASVGSSQVSQLTNVNGLLFFAAEDGTHGRELWRSDGKQQQELQSSRTFDREPKAPFRLQALQIW